METKIRIKMGQMEVEYEGPEAFLKNELMSLLGKVSDLYKVSDILPEGEGDSPGVEGGPAIGLSTRSLAGKLECKTGRDLVVAAAAHLTLSRGAETFTRQQLLTEIQTAKACYKPSYSNNMTKYLDGLVDDGDLNEPSTGTYSLTARARKNLEARLAPGN